MRSRAVIITLLALALGSCSGAATDDEGSSIGDGDQPIEVAQQAVAPGDVGAGVDQVAGLAAGETSGVPAGITVSGAGQASGAPDVVRVTVGVRVVRETVDAALEAANAATDRVRSTLDDAGIPPEDRQTRDFSIVAEYGGGSPDGQPRITGYAVSNFVEVKVRDIDSVGALLTAVADAGGNDTQIQGVSFALEEDGEQVAAARAAAFADARSRAEQYAELAGVSLGGLIGITDTTVANPRTGETFSAEAANADAAVPIEPGAQQVTVRVTVRWSLGS